MTPVTDKIGRMSVPDIHEQRLEALRKPTVERLRASRSNVATRLNRATKLLWQRIDARLYPALPRISRTKG